MKRVAVFAVLALLVPGLAFADSITITAPTFDISNANSSGSLTLTAAFLGSYNVAGYDIVMDLSGRNGATGLAFTGDAAAAQNYVLTLPHNGVTGTVTATHIFGQDSLSTGTETIANTTRNMNTATFSIAPGTTGVFDVQLSIVDGFNDGNVSFGNQILRDGTITVTPEPATITLLAFGLGGIAVVLWRRRRVCGR